MKYAGLNKNDITAAPGICVTFYTQGCPHHCEGCHNPETWDYDGGMEFTQDVITEIIEAIPANGIHRNFCIMGGEPLCPENLFLVRCVIDAVKEAFPDIKIYIWTGYLYEQLKSEINHNLKYILSRADVLIDGPFVKKLRDITLPMRGSSNQRIIHLTKE